MRRRDFIGVVGGLAGSGLPAWPTHGAGAAADTARRRTGHQARPGHRRIRHRLRSQERAQIVIDRARVAFVDTVGVMLAGSQHHPTDIICDMIKLEGSAPAATIVGRDLRATPQLAALANGVSGHAMDYDLTYFAGQSIAPLFPPSCRLPRSTKSSPSEILSAFIIGAEVCGRMSRAAPTMSRTAGWHATGTVGTMAAAAACARLLQDPRRRPFPTSWASPRRLRAASRRTSAR